MDKIFDNKKTYMASDGAEMLNLSIPCVDISKIGVRSMIKVSQDEAGRLDRLVWKNVGHDMSLIDDVMYINHIFNPFAVEEGDMLRIPVNSYSDPGVPVEPSLPDGSKYSSVKNGKKSKSNIQTIRDLIKS